MLAPIFGLTLVTGFAFMVIWAVRFATKPQLKSAVSWFLAIGIVGTLLAGTLSGMAVRRFSSLRPGYGMMGGAFRDADGQKDWFGCSRAQSSSSSAALRK
ncbi:MAG: hypothetical protein PHO20_01295 [Candidatus Peribacteraceae bacterium]|nr:hypothetical protein [Candidatus Peribacteraceae bacterium]MDD5739383.1 hypothetical protein [Candidatus Peribacteraceae bacterium]